MIRVELQPSYILARRPYRDSSLLLEVLTQTHGRLGIVARGVQTPRSRGRASLQLGVALLLSWQQRGELGRLLGFEDVANFNLPGPRLFSLFYVNELLLKLTPRHDPHPQLFDLYTQVLLGLSQADEQLSLRRFEVQLLQQLGYGLAEQDIQGQALQPDSLYYYSPTLGAQRQASAAEDVLVTGATLLALARGQAEAADVRTAKQLMRAIFNQLLNGRALNSRRLHPKAVH